jgi:LysM repeat protein
LLILKRFTLNLELCGGGFYFRIMKRISWLAIICMLCATATVRAQTPATSQEVEEDLKRLKAVVDDLHDAQDAQTKTISALRKEISDLREQVSKPTGNYASQEDLKRLADAVEEIDKKRQADKELILKKLSDLGKTLTATPLPPPHREKTTKPAATEATSGGSETATSSGHDNETGYEYVVKSGDTFSVIAQAYREKGVKVTSEQIAKANPKVNPGKLRVGQKLWIPESKPAGK